MPRWWNPRGLIQIPGLDLMKLKEVIILLYTYTAVFFLISDQEDGDYIKNALAVARGDFEISGLLIEVVQSHPEFKADSNPAELKRWLEEGVELSHLDTALEVLKKNNVRTMAQRGALLMRATQGIQGLLKSKAAEEQQNGVTGIATQLWGPISKRIAKLQEIIDRNDRDQARAETKLQEQIDTLEEQNKKLTDQVTLLSGHPAGPKMELPKNGSLNH